MKKNNGFESICVHDRVPTLNTTPQQTPIYATSSFAFDSIEQGIDVFLGNENGHFYSRYGNPTVEAVADKIAALEGFGLPNPTFGLMTSSGMSAIATLFFGILKTGDKVLTQGNLYGGTNDLFEKVFRKLGIETVIVDLKNIEAVENALKNDAQIKLIYLETPANPTLACYDLAALAAVGKANQCWTVADNTFATPFLQQPLAVGVDFVIHSTTKYLNGHGNSTAGIVLSQHETLMKKEVFTAMKLVGTNLSPFEAFLTNTGLKTLSLRMEKHCANAMKVAIWLTKQKQVQLVNYPGLASHPDHILAKKQMKNGFGAMLSFELAGGLEAGKRFMNRVKFCQLAPTMGDAATLILHPATMSHLNVPKEQREKNGISDGLIRLSVGIENVDDIIADLKHAIK
ncbi:MAG: hypothetical protein RL757_80 [Bacteroidota bacterium]|jgi:methionine-gamma-lyase